MKRFRRLALFSLLMLSVSLNGCGFKDIDKRFFVVGMAIDAADNPDRRYKVTVKLAIPKPVEQFAANNYTLVSEETNSIAEALRKIKSKIDKEMDLGQLKIVVFGQQIVERGDISDAMDWLSRRRDVQKIAWITAGKPNGKAILDLQPRTERIPSNMVILAFGQAGTETAYVVSEYLHDFRRRMKERGLDPILPLIQTRGNEQVSINQVILLDKEKQKIVLSPMETKILNSFYQGVGKYDIRVNLDDGFFVIAANNAKGSFSIREQQGKAVIRLSVHVSGIIEEASVPVLQANLPSYERMAEAKINETTLALFQKLQQVKVDPVGFGLRYRGRHIGNPDLVWKKWLELYPNAQFEIKSKVTLFSAGQLGR